MTQAGISKRSGLCLAINHSACDKNQWLLYEKLRLGQQDFGISDVAVEAMRAVETGRCQGIRFVKKTMFHRWSCRSTFNQVPGTIPATDAPSEPLPPFYSGEAGFTPRGVSAQRGEVLRSAERFMSVKTKGTGAVP